MQRPYSVFSGVKRKREHEESVTSFHDVRLIRSPLMIITNSIRFYNQEIKMTFNAVGKQYSQDLYFYGYYVQKMFGLIFCDNADLLTMLGGIISWRSDCDKMNPLKQELITSFNVSASFKSKPDIHYIRDFAQKNLEGEYIDYFYRHNKVIFCCNTDSSAKIIYQEILKLNTNKYQIQPKKMRLV